MVNRWQGKGRCAPSLASNFMSDFNHRWQHHASLNMGNMLGVQGCVDQW